MSPILTRPVREQLEHDRVIRQLQTRYKRKNEVIINPGNEQNQSVTVGELVVFPDLLLFAEGGRRLLVTVEVETGESVNAIEARAEWGVYSKLKVPLHLYVPPSSVDAVKRICAEYQILVSELWTYTTSFDQVRFNMVNRAPDAPVVRVTESSPERTRAEKPAPAPRQVQGRVEPARAVKPAAVKARPAATLRPVDRLAKGKLSLKPKPAATLRPAHARPEQSRGPKAKTKVVAKAKPAAKAKAKVAKPAAKKGAKKSRK